MTPPISLGNGVPVALTMGDFGNGRLDLAVAEQDSQSVAILTNEGNGKFEVTQTIALLGDLPTTFRCALAAGDFTGDGETDFAVAETTMTPRAALSCFKVTGPEPSTRSALFRSGWA